MPTIVLDLDSSGAVSGLHRYNSEIDRSALETDTAFSRMREGVNKYGLIAAAALAGAGAALVGFGVKAVQAASQMEETQGKFDVVFRGMTDTAEQWSQELSNNYGQSIEQSKRFLSSTQDLLVPMGMARDAAGQMSFEVTKLATDLGSFNNLPTEQVINDMQSALVGNYETMKKYGIILSSTSVEQEILTSGMAASKEEITQSMKAQAAYTLMVRGSSDAVGDFARTQDSFANQMKIFESTLNNLQVVLGTYLLPYATQFITYLNTWASNQANLNKVITASVTAVQFLYNGFMGLKLLAEAITVAYSQTFNFIMKGLTLMSKPLSLMLDGLVLIGTIDYNPIKKMAEFTQDFADAQVDAFKETADDIEKTNASFDRLTAEIGKSKSMTESLAQASKKTGSQIKSDAANSENAINKLSGALDTSSDKMSDLGEAGKKALQGIATESDTTKTKVTTMGIDAVTSTDSMTDSIETTTDSLDTMGNVGTQAIDSLTYSVDGTKNELYGAFTNSELLNISLGNTSPIAGSISNSFTGMQGSVNNVYVEGENFRESLSDSNSELQTMVTATGNVADNMASAASSTKQMSDGSSSGGSYGGVAGPRVGQTQRSYYMSIGSIGYQGSDTQVWDGSKWVNIYKYNKNKSSSSSSSASSTSSSSSTSSTSSSGSSSAYESIKYTTDSRVVSDVAKIRTELNTHTGYLQKMVPTTQTPSSQVSGYTTYPTTTILPTFLSSPDLSLSSPDLSLSSPDLSLSSPDLSLSSPDLQLIAPDTLYSETGVQESQPGTTSSVNTTNVYITEEVSRSDTVNIIHDINRTMARL